MEKASSSITVYFNNGTRVNFWITKSKGVHVYLYIDNINEIGGKDVFLFYVNPSSSAYDVFNPYVWPYTNKTFTREIAMNNATYGCKTSTSKNYCAALIMLDGWKIAGDYPW